MNFKKPLVVLGAAVLIVASFVVSIKLGVGVVLAIFLISGVIRGSSSSDGIIGVDHVNRPRSSTYGGGFSPGGLYGVSGLGSHFGVYGAPVSDPKSPSAEYYPLKNKPALSKKQRRELAAAIKRAEARTGHQILAVVGSLEENSTAKADRVASEWPTASIIVCIDPALRIFELRWRDASYELTEEHTTKFAEMLHSSDLTAAIALLADVLPTQTAGSELPDIIDE
jgi:hypothetical protein